MTASNQDMQVSVSFGKFENDSLSWEKFSSFSPNKYLEEVEKCATPGSVAQKKAYFESHYKNIAEKKVEIIMEQEKQLERNASFWSSVQNQGNRDSENDGSMMIIKSSACDESNGESTSKLESGFVTEVNETCNHEPLEDEECQNSVDVMDDLNSLKLEKLEEIVRMEEKPELIVQVEDKENPKEVVSSEEEIKEDISSKDAGEMIETPVQETKKEKDHNLIKKTDKNSRTNHTRGSPKPNQMNKKPVAIKTVTSRKTQPCKEKSMTKTTNKSASPLPKAPGFSTLRTSKPASMSTSLSSVKKENVSTLPRKKQTAPKSLQNSLNLDQPVSDPTALATTRKSLIMERMGDKDIVRRAFKSFQKSFDQLKSSGDGQDTAPKQVPAKTTTVSKLSTASQKETGRLAKSYGREKNGSNSHLSAYFVPESNGTVKKQEVTCLKSKPNCIHLLPLSRAGAIAQERIRLQAKPKAEATNAKTRRQSLDPKAKSCKVLS